MPKMPSDLRVSCGAVVAFDPLTWDNWHTSPQRKAAPNQRELTGAYDHLPTKDQ